jgi:hypothetical protein
MLSVRTIDDLAVVECEAEFALSASDSALLTRRKDGTLVLALWNYAPPAGFAIHGRNDYCA